MSERNQTADKPRLVQRTESTRSLEDKGKYQAIATLTELGLFIPFHKAETFHGRAGKGKPWAVDRNFSKYNGNVNGRPTLYTSDPQTAREFAEARAFGEHQIEVYQIITGDSDAVILDSRFEPTTLNDQDQEKYFQALRAITLPIALGAPVPFEDRDALRRFAGVLGQFKKSLLLEDDIPKIAAASGINESTALHLSSAYNARQMSLTNIQYLAYKLLQYPADIVTEMYKIDGEEQRVPINLEYAERYMRENHIIAIKQYLSSATLERHITSISFFDLEKIGTRNQIESQKQVMLQRMGGLMDRFPTLPRIATATEGRDLLIALDDAHVKPKQLVEAAKQIGIYGLYGKIYDSDAGNWEKFTVGEHTGTVLRNFDENFAEIVPVQYLAPLRLAILVHDLGQPMAVDRRERYKEKFYNAVMAKNFLTELRVEPRMTHLIAELISSGSDLAFAAQRQPDNQRVQTELRSYAANVVSQFLDEPYPTESQILSFMEMCKIVQLCDGGAYTSMAITRREGKGHFRNAPAFNVSFSEPKGPGKRDIRYKTIL